jgi:hypothetical protein
MARENGTEITFEVDGQELTDAQTLPVMVRDILAVLDALPDGKLITSQRLCQEIGRVPGAFHGKSTHPVFRDYRVDAIYNGVKRKLYGNKRTIAAYRERYGGGDG